MRSDFQEHNIFDNRVNERRSPTSSRATGCFKSQAEMSSNLESSLIHLSYEDSAPSNARINKGSLSGIGHKRETERVYGENQRSTMIKNLPYAVTRSKLEAPFNPEKEQDTETHIEKNKEEIKSESKMEENPQEEEQEESMPSLVQVNSNQANAP